MSLSSERAFTHNAELLEEILGEVAELHANEITDALECAGTVENLTDLAGNIDEAITAAKGLVMELETLRKRIKPKVSR